MGPRSESDSSFSRHTLGWLAMRILHVADRLPGRGGLHLDARHPGRARRPPRADARRGRGPRGRGVAPAAGAPGRARGARVAHAGAGGARRARRAGEAGRGSPPQRHEPGRARSGRAAPAGPAADGAGPSLLLPHAWEVDARPARCACARCRARSAPRASRTRRTSARCWGSPSGGSRPCGGCRSPCCRATCARARRGRRAGVVDPRRAAVRPRASTYSARADGRSLRVLFVGTARWSRRAFATRSRPGVAPGCRCRSCSRARGRSARSSRPRRRRREGAPLEVLGWVEARPAGRPLSARRSPDLFPSRWQEPFGMVGIEALSFGVPVVAWSPERCTNGTGARRLVHWGDVRRSRERSQVRGEAAPAPAALRAGRGHREADGLVRTAGATLSGWSRRRTTDERRRRSLRTSDGRSGV